MKVFYSAIFILLFSATSINAQLIQLPHKIVDDLNKHALNDNHGNKRSNINPKVCGIDTVEFPRYRGTAFFTVTVNSGRSLGQLYDAPSPITLSGFTFYAFVAANPPSPKKMRLICNVYNASSDSLPTGTALRSDTITIDSTFGGGVLSRIEKHATFKPITLNGKYILTVESDSINLNAGVVTNSYSAGNGRGHNLNCGSISGIWYNGRNLNIAGVRFDCDILLHPHVKYNFGTDFSIVNNCYNLSDSVKFINASPNNVSGSNVYNRYEYFNLGYICHLWNTGVNQFQNFNAVNYAVKYTSKQDYKIRLISRIYGYRGPNFNGCIDTTIKNLYFKPDMPSVIGPLNVCVGDSAKLTASSMDTGVVFEWFNKSNSITPFLVGTEFKINQVVKSDTVYVRSNHNGCVSAMRMLIIKANNYPTALIFKDDSICSGSRGILKASTNVGNVLWYNALNSSSPFFTGEIYQTPILNSNVSFFIEANNLGCKLTPRQEIKVNVGSDFAPSPPIVSNDTSVCLTSSSNSVKLNSIPGSGLTTRWYNVGSGGSPFSNDDTFVFNPTVKEIKVFYADAFNGVCGSSRVPVTVTVDAFPSVSGVNQPIICKGDSSVIIVSTNFGGVKWFDASINGNQLFDGGKYVSYPIVNTDYFIETYSGVCIDNTRLKVTTTVNNYPGFTKLWVDPICSKNPAIFNAIIDGPGQVNWYESDTSATILSTGLSFKTPPLNGSKKYFANTVYAGCVGPKFSAQPIVNPSPFTGFSFEILTWQQVRVSPINAGSGAIKWDFGDGKTSNLGTVTHRYNTPGVYNIKLTITSISNGCKDSTTIPVNIAISNLNAINNDAVFSVYPNPTTSVINIAGIYSTLYQSKNIYIYDFNGRLVKSAVMDLNNDIQTINIEELKTGLYLIRIEGFTPQLFNKVD
ncbi:MAG: PKD domain-containing protein [Bacteroidota bacterium]|nr:PKD domain-containing protein [Bacteroidota bacterium]